MTSHDLADIDEMPEEYDEDGNLIEYYAIRPNKTAIKKEIAEIAKVAEELTQLSMELLESLQLPDKIHQALLDARKMASTKPARKRQMKYITAQLREIELDAVHDLLSRLKSQNAQGVREHHLAEKWRDRLIADSSNQALTECLDIFDQADIQHLRQLQRNAQKELQQQKPPKSSRQLYRYLKELMSS